MMMSYNPSGYIKSSFGALSLLDLTANCVSVSVISPINKWVTTLGRDVTHGWVTILSLLMAINVNGTISAHPVKCLTVAVLAVDRSPILISGLIQPQTDKLTFSPAEILAIFTKKKKQQKEKVIV